MANTDNLTSYVIISLSLGLVFILAQISMQNLNPGGSAVFINNNGNPLCDVLSNGCGTYNNTLTNPLEDLPSSSASVSPTTGNIWTDSFTAVKEWVITPGQWILKTLSFPYTALVAAGKGMGVPPSINITIAVLFSTLWYGIGIFFIVNWLTGR